MEKIMNKKQLWKGFWEPRRHCTTVRNQRRKPHFIKSVVLILSMMFTFSSFSATSATMSKFAKAITKDVFKHSKLPGGYVAGETVGLLFDLVLGSSPTDANGKVDLSSESMDLLISSVGDEIKQAKIRENRVLLLGLIDSLYVDYSPTSPNAIQTLTAYETRAGDYATFFSSEVLSGGLMGDMYMAASSLRLLIKKELRRQAHENHSSYVTKVKNLSADVVINAELINSRIEAHIDKLVSEFPQVVVERLFNDDENIRYVIGENGKYAWLQCWVQWHDPFGLDTTAHCENSWDGWSSNSKSWDNGEIDQVWALNTINARRPIEQLKYYKDLELKYKPAMVPSDTLALFAGYIGNIAIVKKHCSDLVADGKWHWSCDVPAVEKAEVFSGDCACKGRLLEHKKTGLFRCEKLSTFCGGASFETTLGYAPDLNFYSVQSCGQPEDAVSVRSIALKAAANNKFVMAVNGGGSTLEAVANRIGSWELFEEVKHSSGEFSYQFPKTCQFLSADGGGGGNVLVNAPEPRTWERFEKQPVMEMDGTTEKFTLKAFYNQRAGINDTGVLVADFSGQSDPIETVTLLETVNPYVLAGGTYTIQQRENNRYLDAHEIDDHRSFTGDEERNNTQRWIIQPVHAKPNTYTIQQASNNRYLDAYGNSVKDFQVTTRTAQYDTSQQWRITPVPYEPDTYTVQQVVNGRYLDAHLDSISNFNVVTRNQEANFSQQWRIKLN